MKQTVRLLAAASVLALVPVSANAEEEKPFSGFYVGLETGFGQLKNHTAKDGNRWSVGGIAGYRHQFDNDLVLGLEGGFHKTPDLLASSFGSFFDRKYKPTWSASGLFGYAFGDGKKNLIFAKAGYSHLRIDLQLPDTLKDVEISDALRASLGESSHGAWKLGAGYERKINNILSMRVGVDYTKHKQMHKQLEGKIAAIINF